MNSIFNCFTCLCCPTFIYNQPPAENDSEGRPLRLSSPDSSSSSEGSPVVVAASRIAPRIVVEGPEGGPIRSASATSAPRSPSRTLKDDLRAVYGLAAARWADSGHRETLIADLKIYQEQMASLVDRLLREMKKSYERRSGDTSREASPSAAAPAAATSLDASFGVRLSKFSHELRAPLVNLAPLLATPGVETFQEDMTAILKALGRRIEEIPETTDPVDEPLTLNMGPFTLHTLYEEVRALNAYTARTRGVRLVFDPKGYPQDQMLLGDRYRIGQIFGNLISNAIKFSPKDQDAPVIVRARTLEENESHVTLHFSVEDMGPGIKKENQKNLFRPFSQVGVKADTILETSGLGLSFAHDIAVDAFHGSIGVESDPNVKIGSTFWFSLTMEKSSALEAPATPIPAAYRQLDKRHLAILFVDDEKTAHRVLKTMLGRKNWTDCTYVENGQLAYEQFLARDFAVIVTDGSMPVLDGMGLIHRINAFVAAHSEKRKPLFIFASANSADEMHETLAANGLTGQVGVLPKPMTIAKLEAAIDERLRSADSP